MRNQSSLIDSQVAELVDRASRFLTQFANTKSWKRDPSTKDEINELDNDIDDAIDELEVCLSDDDKEAALHELMELRTLITSRRSLLKRPKNRRGAPTRHNRNGLLRHAAKQIETQGYPLTRNAATDDTESAASIIAMALEQLGAPISESQLNAIVRSEG
jgi:hypothetical protein